MRVTVVRSGGVAGMVLTVDVDAAELDPDAATALTVLVDGCDLVDGPPSTVADGFAYEVTVAGDDGSVRRARFGQGGAPPGADALVAWVIDGSHGTRRLGR
ncbi:protealysin inhibitor emfourin [Actinomycetospora sp. NBRC 106375]|uniref:protealysin inhibitor emfourin n=1 Tax=Actinomycetospora sp. NBRC 106375 TaxID=3032207 RepID=UPI002553AD63|nr:protealysin inhibitor emfourin [Actinomycetospora sp. NBRC 106375]